MSLVSALHEFDLFSIVSKDMDTEVRKVPLGVCARSVLNCLRGIRIF